MMKKVYACLVGNWVCLNNDPECLMGEYRKPPSVWWEESAAVYSPTSKSRELEHSMYGQDYIQIFYLGKDYRIHPMLIQIVSE